MKPIKDLLDPKLKAKAFGINSTTSVSTSTPTVTPPPAKQPTLSTCEKEAQHYDKRMDTLFTRLGAIYGHVWWSSYKSESLLHLAKKEWSEGLCRFNNTTLKEALFYFRENSNFPPTLPQFIERCKSSVRRNNFCSAKAELQQRIDTKIALKHIQDLYALLKH